MSVFNIESIERNIAKVEYGLLIVSHLLKNKEMTRREIIEYILSENDKLCKSAQSFIDEQKALSNNISTVG